MLGGRCDESQPLQFEVRHHVVANVKIPENLLHIVEIVDRIYETLDLRRAPGIHGYGQIRDLGYFRPFDMDVLPLNSRIGNHGNRRRD